VTLRRDKTDQEGRGRVVAIPFGSSAEVCPVRSVRAWLDAAGVSEEPIRLTGATGIQPFHPPMDSETVHD
jgi:hypothetical protein